MLDFLGYAFITVALIGIAFLFVKLLTMGISAISDHDD